MILSKSLDEMMKLFEEILDKEMPVINGFSGTNAWKNIEADAKIELVAIESESKQIFSYMKNKVFKSNEINEKSSSVILSHYDNYDDLIGLGLINIEMKNFESGLSLFIKKSLLDLTAEFKIAKAGSSGEAVERIEGLEDGLNNVKKTFLNNFIKPLMGEVSFALMLKESANIYFKMIYKLDDLAKRFKLDDSELTEVQKSENNIYKQYFELNKSNSVNPSKLISELKNIDKEIDDSSVNVESLYKEYAGYFS